MDQGHTRLPIVLRHRERIADPVADFGEYNAELGIWMINGIPLIKSNMMPRTSQTRSNEGIDQSEPRETTTSPPRTSITKTSEGVDQCESGAGLWGRTSHTATGEGVDQSEAIEAIPLSRTRLTETREGIDQVETSEVASGLCPRQ